MGIRLEGYETALEQNWVLSWRDVWQQGWRELGGGLAGNGVVNWRDSGSELGESRVGAPA